MKHNIIYILLCLMPTFALAYNDKYEGSASGIYIVIVGGIMLINWIKTYFSRDKE